MGNKLFLVTTIGTHPSTFNKKYGIGRSNSLSTGLSIQEKRKWTKEENLPKPKRKILFNKNNIIIHEAFFEYNIGVIIIEAQDHKKAYDVYIFMKYYLELFKNANNFFELEEINQFPKINYTINDFIKLLCRQKSYFIKTDLLYPKLYFDCERLEKCILFVEKALDDKIIIESLKHYFESTYIWSDIDSEVEYRDYLYELESYIQFKDNDYNENGFKYELAFTAAFKGIECFFNKKDFKNRDDIQKSINKCNYPNIKADMQHEYLFEKEIDQNKIEKLEAVIGRYRDLRNASGAHNRMDTPIEKRIYRESVFEIQLLLRNLILTKFQ